MNTYLIVGGAVGSLLLILAIIIAIIDGIEEALVVTGLTVAMVAGCALLLLFWIWVAGGFA